MTDIESGLAKAVARWRHERLGCARTRPARTGLDRAFVGFDFVGQFCRPRGAHSVGGGSRCSSGIPCSVDYGCINKRTLTRGPSSDDYGVPVTTAPEVLVPKRIRLV
jgi:hypothetical protein